MRDMSSKINCTKPDLWVLGFLFHHSPCTIRDLLEHLERAGVTDNVESVGIIGGLVMRGLVSFSKRARKRYSITPNGKLVWRFGGHDKNYG